MTNKQPALMGIIASLIAALLTALFGIFVVLDNKTIYFLAVLLLSFSVIIMVISVRTFIAHEKETFINCAVAFTIAYAVLVSMVYFTQLSTVIKGILNADQQMIVSDAPGNVFFFIDMLGYVFLCVSTLFMLFAVEKRYRLFRVFLGIHSVMAIPTFLLPFLPISFSTNEASGQISGNFILIVWCFVFIPVCLLAADYFRRQRNVEKDELKGRTFSQATN